MELKDRLKFARDAMAMSQHELARKAGVSQSMIGHLESGKQAGTTKIIEIAKALGVDAAWLASGDKRGVAKKKTTEAEDKA